MPAIMLELDFPPISYTPLSITLEKLPSFTNISPDNRAIFRLGYVILVKLLREDALWVREG